MKIEDRIGENDIHSMIQKTADFVRERLSGEGSGHGWEHMEAVWKNAKIIEKETPGVNTLIVELAALFHDVDDWKLKDPNIKEGSRVAEKWLVGLGLEKDIVFEITEVIRKVSFFGPNSREEETSMEGQIVRDADRLEALGAVAWKRVRQFGKAMGIPDINESLPNLDLTEEEYKNFRRKENSGVNHVFEKLLSLKNRLVTKKGKELGLVLHQELKDVVRKYLESIRGKGLVSDSRIEEYVNMLDEPRFN